jgi:acetylornithine deacetylase/succinyl-diaminopimelate desuccinylase-like protein
VVEQLPRALPVPLSLPRACSQQHHLLPPKTCDPTCVTGHYDVQPADPFDLWTTPPFDPQVRDGQLFGRGASDDKGGLLGAVQAVEAVLKSDSKLPINVKFMLEGEEEIGSPFLGGWVGGWVGG